MIPPPSRDTLTVGLLAGGRATRLGGLDKAWLLRDGVPQVERLRERFSGHASRVIVSANRELSRYAEMGIDAIPDRHPDTGPLSGLDALAAATTTPWLFTLPVDALHVDASVLARLIDGAGDTGASAEDDDGLQPLVALWPVPPLRVAAAAALTGDDFSVRGLQRALGMRTLRFSQVRFGNLNTPDDLVRAGVTHD
ncbi:molybdenum cofactor guanylyltransferase [Luteimonas sp. 3794]|uniref:molybdenum cofactor guanylyltransferase n=1 Tax=Luteimonas sp. 3794 TaxID=2817730 RepID=UPI00285BFC12|nr:molybdenum cofactor guanylyltransferase [Luteimonas sp. 3794]MDR6990811.1 molybdopterin-guanine dinucleotide biosynthesis protein A [Luteimonas sp. 3794]